LANLQAPASWPVANSKLRLVRQVRLENWTRRWWLSEFQANKLVSGQGNRNLYFDEGCWLSKDSDHLAVSYFWDLPFTAALSSSSLKTYDLGLVASDGRQIKGSYVSLSPLDKNCAVNSCGYYPTVNPSDLQDKGRLANGDVAYEYKNPDQVELLTAIYDNSGLAEAPVELAVERWQFNNDHPVVFWQDPLGNFLAFVNVKYFNQNKCR
jgi:hypothetical protein